MIPELTLDLEVIKKGWKKKEDQDFVKKTCEAVTLGELEKGIPVYLCDDSWIGLGVYKESKKVVPVPEFFEYGYCDTQEALIKYLRPYIESQEAYFVSTHLLSRDNEKYYKHGSYINKDGQDTGNDYWDWVDEHPEDEDLQEWEDSWLAFSINKIILE